MKRRIAALVLCLTLLLPACTPATPAATPTPAPTFTPSPTPLPTAVPVQPLAGMPQGTGGYKWWNDTTFYEIFVRSFYDSNGDGIGDFNGITQKLDYLQGLGITGLWLMPINPSPSYHGYDVTDYYDVNPQYGTMDDFKNLLAEAHKRGIRIILDMVLNHTSFQHPWFQQAMDPASPYHNWYIWSDTDPGYNGPWGEQVWYPLKGKYYYAIFWDQMPDLNYRNPAVVTEMEKATKFWLDLGVDGFRLDAAKHLVEDRTIQADAKSTHELLHQYFSFYKGVSPNAMTVGELSGDNQIIMAQYVKDQELDMAFDFNLASSFLTGANRQNAGMVSGQLGISYNVLPPLQVANFLTNHDQDRLMTQLEGDPDKVKNAASMLLTAPGVPFVYYGEEVGLKGGGADENKRRPMQWTADANGGFTTGKPWEDFGLDYQTLNVATESADPNSILNHYKTLIQIRNEHAALRVGDMSIVKTNNQGLYSILRVSHDPTTNAVTEAVLVVINLTKAPISDYSLGTPKSSLKPGTYHVAPILGEGSIADITFASKGDFALYKPVSEIGANETLIMQIQP